MPPRRASDAGMLRSPKSKKHSLQHAAGRKLRRRLSKTREEKQKHVEALSEDEAVQSGNGWNIGEDD
eukprot:2549827-Lingulodinium_polyedra.AAC.1